MAPNSLQLATRAAPGKDLPSRRPRIAVPSLVAIAAALSLFGLLWLELGVSGDGGFGWERGISHWLVVHSTDRAISDSVRLSHYVADWRGLVLLTVACAFVALLAGRGRDPFLLAASMAVTGLTPTLKELYGRPSPNSPGGESYSFPSGHAIGTMALAAAVVSVLWRTRLRWLAILAGSAFIISIGVAVVAEQGHWPSDVLAGWALAVAWVGVLTTIARRSSTPRKGS